MGLFQPLLRLSTFYAVGAGAAVGGGVMLLVVALRGLPPAPPGTPKLADRVPEIARFLSRRGSLAVIVGLVMLVVTRWPVAAVATGVLVFSWDAMFGGVSAERLAVQRIEALASWAESLRDTIAGAVGLEQAIPSSLRAASPLLHRPLTQLVDRLRTRMPLPDALARFADDLDDPSADLVVAALILNARLRGPGLRDVLGALSYSARQEVEMRQRVAAERRSTRRSVQIVVAVSLAGVFGLVVFNRSYVEPYGDVLGQLVLSIVIGLFAAGFLWLRRLANFSTPSRFLTHGRTAGGPQ